MFNKKIIDKTIKDYKEGGMLPDVWGKDVGEISNIRKITMLQLFDKVLTLELKQLKKVEEERLTSSGLTTDTLIVTWVNPAKSNKLTEDGLVYLKEHHPAWIEEKLKRGYFTWKLR